MAAPEPGSCECECARCDIGAHCGKKSNGCYFYAEDGNDGDDDEGDDEG
ncbi:MAG: hypothetical protein V1807_03120 [Patescibacteria group bacterium]